MSNNDNNSNYNANANDPVSAGSVEMKSLDRQRKKIRMANAFMKPLKWMLRFLLGIVAILAGVTINGVGVDRSGLITVIIIVLLGVIALTVYVEIKSKKVDAGFKEIVVKTSLESAFSNVDYKPGESFNEYTVKASGLMGEYDAFRGSDYLSAAYNGRQFVQSNLYLYNEVEVNITDEYGNSRVEKNYETAFYGRLMMLDYPSSLSVPVSVFDKSTVVGKGAPGAASDDFNERFFVVSEDPVAAMRFLTNPMQVTIVHVANRIARPVSLSFTQGKMFIAIHGSSSFLTDTSGNADLAEQRRRILGEIQAILDIVGMLYV